MRDVLAACHPEVLRLFLLQSHYRNPVDFSDEALAEARMAMNRLYGALKRIKELLALSSADAADAPESPGKNGDLHERLSKLPAQFIAAMDDDFNTARALGHLFEVVRLVNGCTADRAFVASPESVSILRTARETLVDLGSVLGLFLADPHVYFQQDRNREVARRGLDAAEIETLIAARQAARLEKNWRKADEIRDILAAREVTIEDSSAGTTWKFE
jgi:cysteinyl-tRNA synthetase